MRPFPVTELLLLAKVCWALLRAQIVVWLVPTGKLVSPATSGDIPLSTSGITPRVAHLTRRLFAVAHRLPIRPVCLVRAVALAHLLKQGVDQPGCVCAGVRISRGRLEGHAWVEYGGAPLGEDPALIATFAPMATVRVTDFP